MLDGHSTHIDEANIGNVENNNPITLISGSGDGVNSANKQRHTVLKKGGRKLLHHQKAPRKNSPNLRLSDHNNNTVAVSSAGKPAAQAELAAGTQAVLTLHHLKQGAKKEVTPSLSVFCLPRCNSCEVYVTTSSLHFFIIQL